MSRKAPTSARKTDPRVLRTQDALGEALIKLMHEKPFKDITVQDVLDLSHVSRSTFYMHYRDKDDLFLSEVDHFFEMMATLLAQRGENSNRIVPVRELFAHISEVGEFYAAMTAAGKINDVLESAQGHFARAIEQRLAGQQQPERAVAAAQRAALAHALAGAMLSLLTWWIDHRMPMSPAEMDDLYHQMVWSGAGAPADRTREVC
jgi:AcrR family transcriptional regulator